MAFTSWIIAIVILLVIVSVSTIVYFVFRKRIGQRRGAVGAQLDDGSLEKIIATLHSPASSTNPTTKSIIPYNPSAKSEGNIALKSSQTSFNHEFNNNPSSTLPVSRYTCISSLTMNEKKNITQQPSELMNQSLNANVVQSPNPTKEDGGSSVWTDDTLGYSKEESFKISLPLPPPTTSFFSDKVELDSIEANGIYQTYMNASQQGYVAIELDDKPFYSSAAATIQKKAATLRSSLRQSLRRKNTASKSNGTPLSQVFENMSSVRSPVKSSSSESGTTHTGRQSSQFPCSSQQVPSTPTSPIYDSPVDHFTKNNNDSKKTLIRHQAEEEEESKSSNKIMIDTIPPESCFNLPTSPSHFKLDSTSVISSSEVIMLDDASLINEINNDADDQSIYDTDSDVSKDEQKTRLSDNYTTPQEAVSAAHKIIRSASHKSRTRSMVIANNATQGIFTDFFKNGDTVSLTPSAKYATIRGVNRINEDTNRSSPLNIKKRPVSPSNGLPSSLPSKTPNPKQAIKNSTASGSATVSGRNMQQRSNGSNILNSDHWKDLKSATLGRKSTASTAGPKFLRDVFAQPDYNEKSLTVAQENATPSPLVRSSLVNVIITHQSIDTDVVPTSPIMSAAESTSPYTSENNTLHNKMGSNIDTIRRMLQSSWSSNNLEESESSHSLASSLGDMATSSMGSSFRPVASPLNSINPRLQNQHPVSLSPKAEENQQTRNRPPIPIGFMEEGPIPTASFSSSTVLTMIPSEEQEQQQHSRSKIPEKKTLVVIGQLDPQNNTNNNNHRLQSSVSEKSNVKSKKQPQRKTPAQKEREKYLKSKEKH